ncbi:restriction endonuclease subunit S [Vibrio metschnikovii]|nr:restriction endonuclease subunit S [Vibrio metschnikovii]
MAVENLITEHIDIWTSTVKTKSTSGRGSSKKLELYGVKKLRELILELAVRGKLVPQDPSDEPASVLLERIAQEKAQLVKKKKIKKPRKYEPIDDNSLPFNIPSSWKWARIEDLGHDLGQKKPDKTFTYVDVGSINKELGYIDEPSILEHSEAPSRARKLVQKNTVIYSTVRPYLLNIAVIDRDFNPEPIASTAFAIIHPLSGISSSYIYRYLRSPSFIEYVESVQTGIAYPAINDKQFFFGLIPVPPSAEQHRIIAKVDELMALCDQLEQQTEASIEAHQVLVTTLLDTLTHSADANELMQNWARISEHFDTLFTTEESIDQLKQTILQLAVMGKLVHFGADPMEAYVKDVSSFGPRNGLSPKEVQVDTGIKVLKLGATSYGSLNLDESKSVDVDIEKTSHLWLKKGDILIQRGNSANYVGCNCLVKEDVCDVIYPDLMMKIRPSKTVSSEFLSTWLSSPMAREFMWTRMTGTSGTMPKISKKVVEAIPIIVPSRKIQDIIVSKVEELFSICELLKQLISETQQTQSQLTDTIVEQAV